MQQKVAVSPRAFKEIDLLSEATHWTKGQVVDWLIDLAKESKNYRVITITTQPHPEDAQPVKLVTIQEAK